jgi:hypothetical protein
MYTRADELALLGDNAEPADYARLIAEHDALREAASMKKCASSPTPALQQAAPDSSDEPSVAGPTIAPPDVPSALTPGGVET